MTKKSMQVQSLQVEINGKGYFPFTNGEIVQTVMFDKKVKGKVSVVEDFNEIATIQDVKTIDLGHIKTNCLVVEVEDTANVELLILKPKKK